MSEEVKLFDVVIVDFNTKVVSAIIGTCMERNSAEYRQMTGLGRINENYDVEIVDHKRGLKVGDSLIEQVNI